MRRRRSVTRGTAWVTGSTIVTGIVTNYATQFGPLWTRSPWFIGLAVTILAMLTLVAVAIERHPESREGPVADLPDSMRPPALDVRVRGREVELRRLTALVKRSRGRFAVVCGAGGTGKTALAAEVAARAGRLGISVWWVRWRDLESFSAQLWEIAEVLGLPRERGRGMVDLVWRALTKRSRWLLIIDKVDQPQVLSPTGEDIAEYRGWVRDGGRGLLLITSRDTDPQTWGRAAELVVLDSLAIEDAATVLLDAVPHGGDRVEAEALAARLGGFPLALRAAGRSMAQPTTRHPTFAAYRRALESELSDILVGRHHGPLTEDQERALLRYTWEHSLDQLADEGHPLARSLLRVLSLAADAPVPRNMIRPELLTPLTGTKITNGAVDAALLGLYRYGLIVAPPSGRTRSIPCVALQHIVREINAILLAEETDTQPWQDTLDQIVLSEAKLAADAGQAGRNHALLLVPHLVPIVMRLIDDPEAFATARTTLDRVAEVCGDTLELVSHLRQAIHEANLKALGPGHPDTKLSQTRLLAAVDLLERSQMTDE